MHMIWSDTWPDSFYSALQNAVKQLATPTGSAFPGQGQSLGGSSSSTPAPGDGEDNVGTWTNLDPQLKILLALAAAYFFFWLM